MEPISVAYIAMEVPHSEGAMTMASARKSPFLYLFIMVLSALWALAGAPLLPEEWAALPGNVLVSLRQTPHRMLTVLRCWFA